MAVEDHLYLILLKLLLGDAAPLHLAHQELINKQGVAGQLAGLAEVLGGGQVGVLVPKREDGRWLDADKRRIIRNQRAKPLDVAVGNALGGADEPLGDVGSAALAVLGDDHLVAQVLEQQDGLHTHLNVIVVGKLVVKEVYASLGFQLFMLI